MASWMSLRAAIHDLDLGHEEWLAAVHDEARGVFDDGLGTFVYAYRMASGSIHLDGVAGCETAPALWLALATWGAANTSVLASIYRTGASSLDEAVRSARAIGTSLTDLRASFEPLGVADIFSVVGHHPEGFGAFVTAPRRRRSSDGSRQERRCFERLAVELAIAARLRERARHAHVARLSRAEVQVARLLLEGASDKLIAADLGVSLSTVSTFSRRLRKKLGCRTGEEALFLRVRSSATPTLHRRLAILDRLTDAECEIVSGLLVGSSYRAIAQRRGAAIRTVASQCGSIFRKCGVSGRRELAALVLGPAS
jgi:DNA-binding CsgD family transcriptional regulator